MGFSFFSKTLPAFGLDISDGSLKVMQLEKKGKQFAIKACSETQLPKQVMASDAILDTQTFSHLLRQSLDKPLFGKFSTNSAVVNLPESKSFVRVIQIPQMSEAEAENAVPFEAESFIPMPIDQVYMDWQKIGVKDDKINVLLVASPKEFVDNYLSILDKCGIKPVALEVESQSCARAAIPPKSTETSLLLDMHSFRSSLIMVEDGQLQFTSTIPIAGSAFTESLAKSLGISSAKAEEIKKKVGLGNTPEYPNITTALLPVLNTLCAEVKNILKFHAEHSSKQVERIILTGGAAKMKNLPAFLSQQLADMGISKVEQANPCANLNFVKDQPLDLTEILSYTSAVGLAARGAEYEIF